jgi:hypothetical protein
MLQITENKRKIKSRLWVTWLCAVFCMLTQGGLARAASSSEDALRSRVQECYSALQRGDWNKAEKYLTKESKPIFRSETKMPLAAYQIESIKMEADGRTASVVVQVPIVSSAAPAPIPVQKTTLWRLIGRQWYMELPKADLNAPQQTPFGAVARAPTSPPRRSNAVYSRDLKFESTWCSLGVVKGNGVRVARFSFKNVSNHVVTLTDLHGGDCLVLKTKQMEYKPGESGTLEFEFDPSKLGLAGEQSFSQDIMFKAEPGDSYIKLTVAALVTPGPAPPANP